MNIDIIAEQQKIRKSIKYRKRLFDKFIAGEHLSKSSLTALISYYKGNPIFNSIARLKEKPL